MTPTQPRSSSLQSKPVSITPLQRPNFTKHLQNLTVFSGTRSVFQCELKATPDSEVKWFKSGKQIFNSTDYQIDYDRLHGICRLSISEAFAQDSGDYSCIASNPAGSDATRAWLVVKGIFLKKLAMINKCLYFNLIN